VQQAARLQIDLSGFRCVQLGESHHTAAKKADRGDAITKARLAVHMSGDPLAGKIFIHDDLVRRLSKQAVSA
jgi:ribosome-binding protein aMBF1 (putative translation factor)